MARSRNHCSRRKAISITYSESVSVALLFQHIMRMRRTILPFVACPALPYFSTLSQKEQDFLEKKFIEHKMCKLDFCVTVHHQLGKIIQMNRRSQWPRGLRRRFTAARLLRSWVRIPPRAWMFVCCEYCVLSGRGLCDGMIIRSEESY